MLLKTGHDLHKKTVSTREAPLLVVDCNCSTLSPLTPLLLRHSSRVQLQFTVSTHIYQHTATKNMLLPPNRPLVQRTRTSSGTFNRFNQGIGSRSYSTSYSPHPSTRMECYPSLEVVQNSCSISYFPPQASHRPNKRQTYGIREKNKIIFIYHDRQQRPNLGVR